MRSRAAIGNHPIHPALVAIPVGALFFVFVADIAFLVNGLAFWSEMAGVGLAIGVIGALVAAIPGLVDYSGLPAASRVRSVATAHMLLNFTVVGLDAASLYLRCNASGGTFAPSTTALALSFLGFALLGFSGWLGGKMVFEFGAGVVHSADAQGRS